MYKSVFYQTNNVLGEIWPELLRKGQLKYCFLRGWWKFLLPDLRFFLKHVQNVHLDTQMSTPRNQCAQPPWSPAEKDRKKTRAQRQESSGSIRSTKQTRVKLHQAPKRVANLQIVGVLIDFPVLLNFQMVYKCLAQCFQRRHRLSTSNKWVGYFSPLKPTVPHFS